MTADATGWRAVVSVAATVGVLLLLAACTGIPGGEVQRIGVENDG